MKKLLLMLVLAIALNGCKESRCSNGEQNKKEEGIDCGGPCEPCATCSDGVKNQDEADIDCGGGCGPCPIYYPETGTYGTNILNEDTLIFSPGDVSMRAELKEGSTLKVILYSTDGASWGVGGSSATNIIVAPKDGSTQVFEAAGPGIMQVRLDLPGPGPSAATIQFFENSISPTKTKAISWD